MMRQLLGYIGLAVGITTLAPSPAGAQVYPDRVTVKAHAAAMAYQRRARDDNREEQTERTTKTVRLGSDGSLDLSNMAGDITVTRGGGAEATIEIVKIARARSSADAKSQLDLVTVDVAERAGRAEVTARYPNQMHGNINVSVNYNVTAPSGTRVSAHSMSGSIKITEIKGDVSANTMSGDVTITGATRINAAKSMSGTIDISDVKTDGGIEASTMSGDVRFRRVTARRVNGGSISGEVLLENIEADTVGAHSISGEITFSGALARRGRYEFKTNSGDVRMTLSGNTGFEVDANSFSGDFRSDFPMTSHGSGDTSGRRGPRRSHVQGTYGDASAVIDITTFSGSIVIAKK